MNDSLHPADGSETISRSDVPQPQSTPTLAASSTKSVEAEAGPDFGKGAVLYLNQEQEVVGVLLWNIFGRTGLARQLIQERRKFSDPQEISRVFRIHD